MTALREQIGRLLMIGFDGRSMSSALRDLLKETRPGGVILFKRNVDQGPGPLAQLIADCQDIAQAEFGRPLLVAIDQEGGTVKRLAEPFSILPSQAELGRAGDVEQIRRLAAIGARELAAVGVNFNLTPVLDIADDPGARYMLDRSFGAAPRAVGEFGAAVIDGHRRHGVRTCAKHFHGIGRTRLDPHHDLPTVELGPETDLPRHLAPFIRAAAEKVDGVMSAHVFYPRIDPDHPGTFSPSIMTRLLREEVDFRGLALSDDMEMGAVVNGGPIGPAGLQAAIAGCDSILVCHRADRILEVRDHLLRGAEDGRLSRARIREASTRLESCLEGLTPPGPLAWRKAFPDAA